MVSTVKFSEFSSVNLATSSNNIVGVSAPAGGFNFQSQYPLRWTTIGRPPTPTIGTIGFNIDLSQMEVWNGSAWVQLASGGSGSVNPGFMNQLAYYAADGSAVSGLNTGNNGILVTNSGGAPSISSTAPVGLTLPQPLIVGVTNGSNAASGDVGEFISSVIPSTSSLSVSNNVPMDITSISLPAGDWDVYGNASFTATAVSHAQMNAWISLVSSTVTDKSLTTSITQDVVALSFLVSGTVPFFRASLSVTTTIYLSSFSGFSAGSMTVCGGIHARRAR